MLEKTKTHYTAFYAVLMVLVILPYQFVRPASASPYGAIPVNTSSSGIRSAIAPGIAGSLLNMMVASLDGDDVEESVIVVTDAGVFAVKLGVNESSLDLFYPSPSRVLDFAVLSDSDGNGRNEIAIATYDISLPNIVVFDSGTGQELWHHRHEVLTYDSKEEYASDFVKRQTFTWSIARVDDLNGDAKKELVVGSWDTVLMLDGASGNELWSFQADNDVWQVSSADDVTGDGKPDILAGTQDGTVYLIDGFSGALRWSVALSEPYVTETKTVNRAIWDVFSIKDVLGDATPAVVASSEDGYVYLLDGSNGDVVWDYQAFEISVPSTTQTEFWGANFFNLRAFPIEDIIIVLDNSESSTAVQAINSKTGTLDWEKTGLTPSFYDVEIASNVVDNFTEPGLLLPMGSSFSAELGQMVEEILVIDGDGNEIDVFRVPVANYYATAGRTRIVDVMTDVSGDARADVALALDGGTMILFSPVNGKVLSDFPWVRETILQEGDFVGNDSPDVLLISKEYPMDGGEADRFTSRMFAVIDGATCSVSWSYFVPWDEYLKTGGLRGVQAVSDVNDDDKSDIMYYTGPSDFDRMVSWHEIRYNAYYGPQIYATAVSGMNGEVIWSTTVPSWSLTTKPADSNSTTDESARAFVNCTGFLGNLNGTFMDDNEFHSFTNDSSGLARVPYRIDLNPYLIHDPPEYPTLKGMGNLEIRVKAGVSDTSGLAFAGLQIWKRNTTELMDIASTAFNFTEPKELNFTLLADDLDSYAKFPGDPWAGDAQLTLFVTVDTGNVTQTIRVFVDLVQFTFHNPCKENVPNGVNPEKRYNIYSIDQLDDVDGDGFRDFVVGSSPQVFYVVSGCTGKDILNRMQLTYQADNVTIKSEHVYAHAIDDITGDGKRDVVLAGEWGEEPNNLRIVSSDGNFTNQVSFISELENFDPMTVHVIDDVNGDDMPDLSVFTHEEEAPYIRVLGSPNFDVTHFQIRRDINPTIKYAAGDLDGDGVKDTIVAAPWVEEGSSIFVLSGTTGSTIWTWDLGRMEVWRWQEMLFKGFESIEFMPATVVDDITGDGVDDLVIAYTDENPKQAHEIAIINVKDAALHSTISFKAGKARAGDWTLKIPALGMMQFRDLTGDGSKELAFSIFYPPSDEQWVTEYVVVDYRSSSDAKILLRTPFTSLSMLDTQEYVVLNTYAGAIIFPNLDFGVSITQPENTEKSFSGEVTLAWDVEGEIVLQEVFLDGFSYGRVDGNSLILDLASGRHAVEVKVTDRFGVSASDTLFINVQRDNSLYLVLNVIFAVAIVNLIIWKLVGRRILHKLRPKFKSHPSSNQRTHTKKNGGAPS